MQKPKLTHVKHDPSHCLAPGLFRSLKKGDRKKLKLDVIYEYGDGERIEFSGPEPLGADDLRILQGLVAMAGPNGLVLEPDTETDGGKQLRLFLDLKWESVKDDALVIKDSYRALAREIGYANEDDSKPIRECIERLWKVSIIAQDKNKRRRGFRVLSEYASDEAAGKLYVALNPLIAEAVMGGRHIHIPMHEVRAIKGDAARLIHQRLCGWINPGSTRKVMLDTICDYAWPDAVEGAAMRKRRGRAKDALAELATLGWSAKEYEVGKFEIGRPALTTMLPG